MAENQVEEWSMIRNRYSKLSDGALLDLLDSRDQLTDVARELLADELTLRDLQPKGIHLAEQVDEQEQFVRLSEFTDLGPVLFLKSALESLDIEAHIEGADEHTLQWFIEHAQDGVALFVRKKNAEAALEVMKNPYGNVDEVAEEE